MTSRGRVMLRVATAQDQEEFLALRRASYRFLKPWEPSPPPGGDPFDPAVFRNYLKSARTPTSDRSLVCRREDGAILGTFNLSEIVRGAFQGAYLGYWIGESFAGQGYMREALPLLLRRAFVDLKLHRVEANIMPHNHASLALVQGAGFRREGYSPRYLKIAGRWRDHERWAILREDWRA